MNFIIGVASYLNPDRLRNTLSGIQEMTVGEWECLIVHNRAYGPGDEEAVEVAREFIRRDERFALFCQPNAGYCGAVNKLLNAAVTTGAPYALYCDNDVEIRTHGWNAKLIAVLENNPECGWVFPGDGHHAMSNGRYRECLWHAGYCWALKMSARQKLEDRERERFNSEYVTFGYMNPRLGHHEEVELNERLRLAGYQIGCVPEVDVVHHESATRANAEDHKPGGRIHDSIVRWMNSRNDFYLGDQLKYSMTAYDPRMLRFSDWPVFAHYMERFTLANFPNWNANPREVYVPGVGNMDAVEVLKPTGPYRGRAI